MAQLACTGPSNALPAVLTPGHYRTTPGHLAAWTLLLTRGPPPCVHVCVPLLPCVQWERDHMRYNFDVRAGPISVEWFRGATTNIAYNCLDRWGAGRGGRGGTGGTGGTGWREGGETM